MKRHHFMGSFALIICCVASHSASWAANKISEEIVSQDNLSAECTGDGCATLSFPPDSNGNCSSGYIKKLDLTCWGDYIEVCYKCLQFAQCTTDCVMHQKTVGCPDVAPPRDATYWLCKCSEDI